MARTAPQLQPDLVIVEVGMPALTGYHAAQQRCADVGLNSAPMLAMTGYAQERDRVAARAAGFTITFHGLQAILDEAP